ncbi:uncharacterized protein F5147DRAFT_650720 [Suillus discolor]|uniref:Uncharacterized protein n=1 Tax=Suillus discolor TaxID=1912936 RepID=A0A9P7FE30_9AGAM|nr:uncharacterized protein F5147DRAFT_650720 [Suillus discolor]KAG2113216.1 hypothetical protein F5147DRAFT_650720 [Suillus discolor]
MQKFYQVSLVNSVATVKVQRYSEAQTVLLTVSINVSAILEMTSAFDPKGEVRARRENARSAGMRAHGSKWVLLWFRPLSFSWVRNLVDSGWMLPDGWCYRALKRRKARTHIHREAQEVEAYRMMLQVRAVYSLVKTAILHKERPNGPPQRPRTKDPRAQEGIQVQLRIKEEGSRPKDKRAGDGRAQMRIEEEGSGLKDEKMGEGRAPMRIKEGSGSKESCWWAIKLEVEVEMLDLEDLGSALENRVQLVLKVAGANIQRSLHLNMQSGGTKTYVPEGNLQLPYRRTLEARSNVHARLQRCKLRDGVTNVTQ